MGDFALIETVEYLTPAENYTFWLVWLTSILVNCIVFMNFIVAEASATYAEVSEELENIIQ